MVDIPSNIRELIRKCTLNYGKAKLVLKQTKYFIEAASQEMQDKLFQIEAVRHSANSVAQEDSEEKMEVDEKADKDPNKIEEAGFEDTLVSMLQETIQEEEEKKEEAKTYQFQIHPEGIEDIKKDCKDNNFPLMEEYDFRLDDVNPSLDVELKPDTSVRNYQVESLSKMFESDRAKSGIIVLPCGAGKTLVGVMAATTIKKRTMILCTSGVAVDQWEAQFRKWTNLKSPVIKFKSGMKESMFSRDQAGIVVTTYHMISYSGRRAEESAKMINLIESVDWGLMILDEVDQRVLREGKFFCIDCDTYNYFTGPSRSSGRVPKNAHSSQESLQIGIDCHSCERRW